MLHCIQIDTVAPATDRALPLHSIMGLMPIPVIPSRRGGAATDLRKRVQVNGQAPQLGPPAKPASGLPARSLAHARGHVLQVLPCSGMAGPLASVPAGGT